MNITRRNLIKASLALAATSFAPAALAFRADSVRKLHFHNTHTGESLNTLYWEQGQYHPQALSEIAHVLRDHRTNEVHGMDTNLLDLLANLHSRMGSRRPFEVISGYRSPKSNALLHATTNGVAVDSNHMYGKAIDIRLTDRSLKHLRNTAWDMQKGGVGYYPSSNFVHVDTGNIRQW